MLRTRVLYKWFQVVLCGAVVGVLFQNTTAVDAQPTARAQVRLMFMFQGGGQEGSQTVENALTRAFQGYGFSVLDAETVAQTLRRNADLLQRYEVEAAKRLGGRLGADIVISGALTTRVVDKTYEMLGGKKVTVSQADISAKAVLVRSGKVLAAENAHTSKPFDNTGNIALQAAAEELAGKLRQGIEQFLNRDTIDYQLSILNMNPQQSVALQDAMKRVPGVKQVSERSFSAYTLELAVSVERQQDRDFQLNVAAKLAGPDLGRFEMVSREGEVISLRRVRVAGAKPDGPPSGPIPPPDKPPDPEFAPGYRKSWAVVIGINNYQHWPKLEYAVNDAKAVGGLLREFGFDDVITILDSEATRKRILQVLSDDLSAKTQKEDRVFIFFAGHGQTEDRSGNPKKMGYIIPVDGALNNYYDTAVSMKQLKEIADQLSAKHLIFAMDSCFSGLLLRLRGDPNVSDPTRFKARDVLTAGGEGEQVAEVEGHGLFTKALIDVLQEMLKNQTPLTVMAPKLYEAIRPRVLSENQHPEFGQLKNLRGHVLF